MVTNDIYTDEDARFLRSTGVLGARADPGGADRLLPAHRDPRRHQRQPAGGGGARGAVPELAITFVESGGDNLTACFSPALTDTQIFVLDCAGGDDVPRKGGPGVERSDLLVINKTDLAPYVGADVSLMLRDAAARRDGRPVLAVSLRDPADVRELGGMGPRAAACLARSLAGLAGPRPARAPRTSPPPLTDVIRVVARRGAGAHGRAGAARHRCPGGRIWCPAPGRRRRPRSGRDGRARPDRRVPARRR